MGAGSSAKKEGREEKPKEPIFNIKLLAESKQPNDPFAVLPEEVIGLILGYFTTVATVPVCAHSLATHD
jgi:hypothetical protein